MVDKLYDVIVVDAVKNLYLLLDHQNVPLAFVLQAYLFYRVGQESLFVHVFRNWAISTLTQFSLMDEVFQLRGLNVRVSWKHLFFDIWTLYLTHITLPLYSKERLFLNKNYLIIEFKFYYQKVNLNLDPVPEADLVFFPGFGVSFWFFLSSLILFLY